MSEDTVVTWSTKLELAIYAPSKLRGTQGKSKKCYTFERLSISRNREQRTINSVGGARKGFTTVEGDFTLTLSLPETDPDTEEIEKLYSSNIMFDVVLAQRATTPTEPFRDEWKIAQVLASGCMFENVSTTYDANDKPMREYTAKFLKSEVTGDTGNTTSQREGNYATGEVSVSWT
jgi:hypothetical protein